MPALRQNLFTKEWVIIAAGRASGRGVGHTSSGAPVASFVETCPFCPGNESKTPPEVLRSSANVSEPCAVGVIPNQFAVLSSDVQPTRNLQPLRRRINRFGFHEVIIDSPDHARAAWRCSRMSMWPAF
jgi:UDPglucose--hexose-1-phosphate uridylyltransferase